MELKHRRLAIVLLDLIGSTAFVQRVGAMRAATWLQYHDRLARSLLYRFEGREIDRSDGFLLSFERPIDALNFALHYQAQIPQKTKLGARIGVHYGDVVEVTQDELYSAVGAKSVELEGIAKNIAARAMSVCEAGQVILTRDAMRAVRNRTNPSTPKGTRFACVGLYRFKGVSAPVTLYAVGDTIESLQPPRGNEKAKRVGGATYQVPVEVSPKRQLSLAVRWIRAAARGRKGRPMHQRLAAELIDAYHREGAAMTVRENTHRMAEANKAFAHFAW